MAARDSSVPLSFSSPPSFSSSSPHQILCCAAAAAAMVPRACVRMLGLGIWVRPLMQLIAVHLVVAGFDVAVVDHQGHGFTEGLMGHIPDIEPVFDDCDATFALFRADNSVLLPCFLYGESLGEAIELLLHLRNKALPRAAMVLKLLRVCRERQKCVEEAASDVAQMKAASTDIREPLRTTQQSS